MATHGAFGEFESSKEDWTSYTERHFEANDVYSAEKQRAILLISGCGASTYQLIRDLVSPAKPTRPPSR